MTILQETPGRLAYLAGLTDAELQQQLTQNERTLAGWLPEAGRRRLEEDRTVLLNEMRRRPKFDPRADVCPVHKGECDAWPTEPTDAWTDDELKDVALHGTLAQRDAAELILEDRRQTHAMAMGWDKITDADREAAWWDDERRAKAQSRAEDYRGDDEPED